MVKKAKTAPVMPAAISRCGNCGNDLTGIAWTNSPKGRACDYCWKAYMRDVWPKVGNNA